MLDVVRLGEALVVELGKVQARSRDQKSGGARLERRRADSLLRLTLQRDSARSSSTIGDQAAAVAGAGVSVSQAKSAPTRTPPQRRSCSATSTSMNCNLDRDADPRDAASLLEHARSRPAHPPVGARQLFAASSGSDANSIPMGCLAVLTALSKTLVRRPRRPRRVAHEHRDRAGARDCGSRRATAPLPAPPRRNRPIWSTLRICRTALFDSRRRRGSARTRPANLH